MFKCPKGLIDSLTTLFPGLNIRSLDSSVRCKEITNRIPEASLKLILMLRPICEFLIGFREGESGRMGLIKLCLMSSGP